LEEEIIPCFMMYDGILSAKLWPRFFKKNRHILAFFHPDCYLNVFIIAKSMCSYVISPFLMLLNYFTPVVRFPNCCPLFSKKFKREWKNKNDFSEIYDEFEQFMMVVKTVSMIRMRTYWPEKPQICIIRLNIGCENLKPDFWIRIDLFKIAVDEYCRDNA